MFTGIVTGVGRVVSLEKRRGTARLSVSAPSGWTRFRAGESVCVAGVCLTAVEGGKLLVADLSAETLRRSRLGRLETGEPVNLERALRWGDRASGHFVLGHVDGLARLLAIREEGGSWRYRVSIPRGLSPYVVPKGSVSLDGISLTIASRGARHFDVAVIPETRRRTTLGSARTGTQLHFEADVFARYGVRWRSRIRAASGRRR